LTNLHTGNIIKIMSAEQSPAERIRIRIDAKKRQQEALVKEAQDQKARQLVLQEQKLAEKRTANKTALKATGVVAAFKELKHYGAVKMSDQPVYETKPGGFWGRDAQVKVADYIPAKLSTGLAGKYSGIREGDITFTASLYFNKHNICVERISADGVDYDEEEVVSSLTALMTEDGSLTIQGEYDRESERKARRVIAPQDINQKNIFAAVGEILEAVEGLTLPRARE